MRILLAHKFFYKVGGAEVFFFEVGRLLEEKGHKVAYFSTCNEKNERTEYSKYFTHAPFFSKSNLFKSVLNFGKIVYSFESKNKFRKLIINFKPDIVHVFAIYSHISLSVLDVCREFNIPVVMSCNDYKHICPNSKIFYNGSICNDCKDEKFVYSVINRCCNNSLAFSVASAIEAYVVNGLKLLRKNVHTFLFSSDFMAKKTEEFWGKEKFRWRKFMNPYDSIKFKACYEYDNYFLYFGRLVEEKGVDILIRAMENIPQVKLIIIGNGPEEFKLKRLCEQLNLKNIEFVGPKWGCELHVYLRKSRFVVFPSIWEEVFGYVILQAFSFGKPVIASDRGGIPALVKNNEYGLIYSANNIDALRECILTLWNSPELAIKMGKAAKNYVDINFNDEKTYSQLTSIYKEILDL